MPLPERRSSPERYTERAEFQRVQHVPAFTILTITRQLGEEVTL